MTEAPKRRFPATLPASMGGSVKGATIKTTDRLVASAGLPGLPKAAATANPGRVGPAGASLGGAKSASSPLAPTAQTRWRTGGAVAGSPQGLGLDSQAVRHALVQRLRQQPHMHESVLAAIAAVPRHVFVESALVNQAYADTSLPIGWGQTISKPSVVARMLSLLNYDAQGRLGKVLEIGTGCGYQAALLGRLSRHVVSVERIEGLYQKARGHLRELGVTNVQTIYGDGMRGHGPSAPFQSIIAAAGGEAIPQTWLDQLALGGRLVAPCAAVGGGQALVVVEHTVTGFVREVLEPVLFVPLKSGVNRL